MNYTPFNTKALALKNRFTPLIFVMHPAVMNLDVLSGFLLGLNKRACDNELLRDWIVGDVYKLSALTVI